MTSRLARLACLPFVFGLMLGCAAEPSVRDLGPLGAAAKADFTGFDFRLPTIDEGGTLALSFTASGAFRVELSQPDVASSKRATARLRLDDGDRDEETASSRSPSIDWTPEGNAPVRYALTIINRSHTRTLTSRLVITDAGPVAEAFAPPASRRTLANLHPAASGQQVALALFDADSTLRISKSGKKTPDGPEDVMLLPGVARGVQQAVDQGMLVAVVSNQGGVHYGYTTFANAEAALAKTAELLAAAGVTGVHYFDFAPDYDEYRKPATGMADLLAQKIEDLGATVDWSASVMVGDAGWKRNVDAEPDGTPGDDFSSSDRGLAEALGVPFHHPRDYFGWAPLGVRNFHKPEQVSDFLAEHPDFD